jgi:hypothetical protein
MQDCFGVGISFHHFCFFFSLVLCYTKVNRAEDKKIFNSCFQKAPKGEKRTSLNLVSSFLHQPVTSPPLLYIFQPRPQYPSQ